MWFLFLLNAKHCNGLWRKRKVCQTSAACLAQYKLILWERRALLLQSKGPTLTGVCSVVSATQWHNTNTVIETAGAYSTVKTAARSQYVRWLNVLVTVTIRGIFDRLEKLFKVLKHFWKDLRFCSTKQQRSLIVCHLQTHQPSMSKHGPNQSSTSALMSSSFKMW